MYRGRGLEVIIARQQVLKGRSYSRTYMIFLYYYYDTCDACDTCIINDLIINAQNDVRMACTNQVLDKYLL